MVARILRFFSYLYHLAFAVYLLGVSAVAAISSNTLKMPFLPWSGETLTQWLMGGSIIGIASIFLAVTGIFRFLFPLWALAMLVVLVRGFLIQPYAFETRDQFHQILWLVGGAVIAFLASLTLFRPTRRRRA